MNSQIRKLFLVVLVMFCALALMLTNNHVLRAPALNADGRNARMILHAAETDRGPIIVAGEAIAVSEQIPESQRYQRLYPKGALYSHVTGYFSSAFSQATGLEAATSQILDGESDALLVQRLRNLFTGKTRQGGGVVLTINPAMQQAAADALGDRRGAVVAMDVTTGAILALYSSPSYDPNALAGTNGIEAEKTYQALLDDPNRPLYNRAIAGDLYAPGSTFKVLTTMSLLEKGVVQPDSIMDSPQTTTLPGTEQIVENYGGETCGDGKPTLTEAFARSCNTTYVLASEKLTRDDLADLTTRFGFGLPLSIPLSVTPSVFPAQADSAQVALASIGQFDVRTTPLQMARIAQTIANGGTMMAPYLVDQVVDADLQTQQVTEPEVASTPISAEIAAQMTAMMRQTVEADYGTATKIAIPGIAVAAKTGTAETGNGSTIPSIIAFAPADAPKIAIAVFAESMDSDAQPTGGDIAAPIARQVLEAGLK